MPDKDLSETPEFFVPEPGWKLENYLEKGTTSGIHHLARYMWVRDLLPNAGTVLDIACGAGYGTAFISQHKPGLRVIGVDYDPRAIEHAQGLYRAPNLEFRRGDVVRWAFEDGQTLGKYDAIVSFDTIEHIHHREIVFMNFAEQLAADGALYLSTPCGHPHPVLNPPWEHHKIEYSGAVLLNILRRFFDEVSYPDNDSLPGIDFWRNLNRDKRVYWNRMNPVVCRRPRAFGTGI